MSEEGRNEAIKSRLSTWLLRGVSPDIRLGDLNREIFLSSLELRRSSFYCLTRLSGEGNRKSKMEAHDSHFGRLNTVDDLIRKLADEGGRDAPPIIAFPTSGRTGSNHEYEFFRARDLDRLAEGVAATYLQCQLQPVVSHISACPRFRGSP
jgi:hypothetical protein